MSEAQKEKKPPSNKTKQFIEILKFTGFSISAGVIQFVSTGLLSTWTGLMSEDSQYYWIAYLVGLILSVVWNFTFNRKFTFKSASNVPLAMGLVVIYYCAFAPLSTFGADAIVDAWKNAAGESWNANYEMVITAGMMIINFVTEFVWDKFVVFNDKVINKLLPLFKKKKNEQPAAETAAPEEEKATAETVTELAEQEIAVAEETASETKSDASDESDEE